MQLRAAGPKEDGLLVLSMNNEYKSLIPGRLFGMRRLFQVAALAEVTSVLKVINMLTEDLR